MRNEKSSKRLIALAAAVSGALLACGVIVGCGGKTVKPPPEPPVPTPPDPPIVSDEELSEIIEGNVRVQLLSDNLVRIEEKTAEGFEDRASYYVLNRNNWHTVKYDVRDADGYLVITTANYTVKLKRDASDISDAGVYAPDGSALWNYTGETSPNIYLPSPSDALDVWYFSDTPRIIPSEYGYESYVDEYLQGWDFSSVAPDFFVFVPDGDYKTFCRDYTTLTGKSEMVQLTTLGFWDSRWYAYSSETALQQIADYRDKGYSLDVLVIDTDWRDSTGGVGYEINKNLFPDMAAFLEECHKLGVSVAFNDHPEPVGGTTNGLESDEVNYRNDKLTMILSLGLDYWWYDRNWGVSLESCDPDVSVYAFGMYAYQFITDEYLHSIADVDEYAERALIMGNVDGCLHGKWLYASDISAHRYSIQWTGDVGSDMGVIAQEIENVIKCGSNAVPYLNSDCGGHLGNPDKREFIRWMQYGTLSPVFRPHCTNTVERTREPWAYDAETEDIVREYNNLRYRLLPVIYKNAYNAYATGEPIFKSLGFEYPHDKTAIADLREYMLGNNILVSPMAGEHPLHIDGQYYVMPVKATYYDGRELKGEPIAAAEYKTLDITLNHTSPEKGVPVYDFSARFSTALKFADPVELYIRCDDGATVFIDGEKVLEDKTLHAAWVWDLKRLEPNKEYKIEIEYFQAGGEACCELMAKRIVERTSEHKAYLPADEWLDAFGGARYTGAKTVSREYGLREMPLFVRLGAVVPLAYAAHNTKAQKWDRLVLDWYADRQARDDGYLYEDDTETTAYKLGRFRTTEYGAGYCKDCNAFVLNIEKAQGAFDGDKCFKRREITVKRHVLGGARAVKATVNGKAAEITHVAKNASAFPLNTCNDAPDGECELVTFAVDASESCEVKFYL